MTSKHFLKANRPVRSRVYDVYWRFAAERFEIFRKRLTNSYGPWTDDPVIQRHRFTNVFRASDRVSQFLINLQNQESSTDELFFKTILFKLFNKIETYNYLESELGEISYRTFSLDKYDELLTYKMATKKTIYSAAYIMPSAGNVFGYKYKHTNHLALLNKMMVENLHTRIKDCKSLEDVYKLILAYPSLGSFLAFQYTIDLNYSSLINFSEMDFVVAGPGAKNGINKCFDSLGDFSYEDVIKMMTDDQESECERLEITLPNLWGRNLQLIDCQNLFCEVDKYLRVTHPEVGLSSGRTRIKQKYTLSKGPINLFFPPKWNINVKIENLCQTAVNDDIFL